MSDKQCNSVAVLILLTVVALCFSGTAGAGFVSDDFVLVNRVAGEGYYSSWGGETGSVFFRPVTTLSYLCDFQMWGINPIGFHLTNLLWHFFAGLAVFFLFKTMMNRTGFKKPCLYAMLTAVLFLSLASHSESVAWVSGRTDIIATALCLASAFFYYRQLNKPSTFHAALALVFFCWPAGKRECDNNAAALGTSSCIQSDCKQRKPPQESCTAGDLRNNRKRVILFLE